MRREVEPEIMSREVGVHCIVFSCVESAFRA